MEHDGKLTKTERETILAELRSLAEIVKHAYATNDVDLYLSAFDPDAIVSMPGTPAMLGHEALRTAFVNRSPLPPGATFEVRPLEIEALSSEWAYALGTDILQHPNGKAETMTFLVLIRKSGDGWKTFREVVSADQP